MFNLTNDNILLSVSANIENTFIEELKKLEIKDADEVQLIFEKKMEEVEIDHDLMHHEKKRLSMSPGEKRAIDHKRLLTTDLNRFIGSLQIPCYDNISYYYYYDILEVLSRNLFQYLLSKAKDELLQKEE